jgi:predicted AlkP superfamily phosphohydrolase/phosphomutase
MTIKDPQTGKQVVEQVFRRDEVYSGKYSELAPDLVIQFMDDRYSGDRYFFGEGDYSLWYKQSFFRRPHGWGRGDHSRDGILILHGSPFRQGVELSTTSIEDVAPTILHTLGEPVPGSMTGQVITEALTESYRQAHPVQVVDDPALKHQVDETGLTPEEEQLLADRLRDLGYLE